MNYDNKRNISKREIRKVIRTLMQICLFVVIIGTFIYKAINPIKHVSSKERNIPLTDSGFLAISYFGIEKFESESRTLVLKERFREQMEALYNMGYVTIDQYDIIDYYNEGIGLPEKSLFLLFEDGRRDTAIFAQDVLEEFNYKGNILSYANKFEQKDNKFLSEKDLQELEDTSFWELGTNGYRLSYINVFDRYGNYFGHLNSDEFITVADYLGREYNHYLMDFKRDEYGIVEESYEEMKERLQSDYDNMKNIYLRKIGYMPKLYVLMHSNTGKFGTNDKASEINEENIRDMFQINFNREGSSFNDNKSSIYDLTRMQPQKSWYVNHLLMRIKDDTSEDVDFKIGDEEENRRWNLLSGVAEFRDNIIVLTTEPRGNGKMVLEEVKEKNVSIDTTLLGTVSGGQDIWLRYNDGDGICVGIENNILNIKEKAGQNENELYSLDLFEFDGGAEKSVEEDELQGLIVKENAALKYSDDYFKLQDAHSNLDEYKTMNPRTLEDGGEGFVPTIDQRDTGNRKLEIKLLEDKLSVWIDGKEAVADLTVSKIEKGKICLEASVLSDDKYNQRNLYDDVYDAVYMDFRISAPETSDEIVYYEYRLGRTENAIKKGSEALKSVANYFMDNF